MPYCSFPASFNRNTKMTCAINWIDYQCKKWIFLTVPYVSSKMLASCILFIHQHFRLNTLTLYEIFILFQFNMWAAKQSRATHFFGKHYSMFAPSWTFEHEKHFSVQGICPRPCSLCFTFTVYRYRNNLVIKYSSFKKGTSLVHYSGKFDTS